MLYCVLSSKPCSHVFLKEVVQPQEACPAGGPRHSAEPCLPHLAGTGIALQDQCFSPSKRNSHIHLSLPVTLLNTLLLKDLLLWNSRCQSFIGQSPLVSVWRSKDGRERKAAPGREPVPSSSTLNSKGTLWTMFLCQSSWDAVQSGVPASPWHLTKTWLFAGLRLGQ